MLELEVDVVYRKKAPKHDRRVPHAAALVPDTPVAYCLALARLVENKLNEIIIKKRRKGIFSWKACSKWINQGVKMEEARRRDLASPPLRKCIARALPHHSPQLICSQLPELPIPRLR
jgi:hypothetical protein